jgi:NAD/NADP transhydrogenase beta subunit
MSILKELFTFLKQEKKYWLWPLIIVLVLLGLLIVLAEGSALAPFIYSLF